LVLIWDVWKCTPIVLDGVNFAKENQKDSYNQRIFIEKFIDDKKILTKFKKIHTFKNVEF
jgi:hypothetical protein